MKTDIIIMRTSIAGFLFLCKMIKQGILRPTRRSSIFISRKINKGVILYPKKKIKQNIVVYNVPSIKQRESRGVYSSTMMVEYIQ